MKWVARAPGKVIIVGEHFVVHGAWALGAAVNRYCTVEVEEAQDEGSIYSKNLGLRSKMDVVDESLQMAADAVKNALDYMGSKRRVSLTIDSDIPVASGMGSSAALCVAITTALSRLVGTKLTKDEILKTAITSEKLVHGNPSGIDPAISISGGILLYKKGEPPQKIQPKSAVRLAIGCSKEQMQTSRMVRLVASKKEKHPIFFQSLTKSSSDMSRQAASFLISNDLVMLGSMLNFYQTVLDWLGVSTPLLNKMIEKSLEAGAYGAKLTGGGGGGCMIALPRPGKVQSIIASLAKMGLPAFVSSLNVKGVEVWEVES